MFRIGIGQDSHPFVKNENKILVLGGVIVENSPGLEGNSDGDVIIHALCNAMEQAIGGDSLSAYADQMCKQGVTDSREYLKIANKHIKERDYQINNLGISIEAKEPRILPIADQIRESLAKILQIEKEKIGINATTGERLTTFGKGDGIQVWAVVNLLKKEEK